MSILKRFYDKGATAAPDHVATAASAVPPSEAESIAQALFRIAVIKPIAALLIPRHGSRVVFQEIINVRIVHRE
jgi:hypothetical protein